MVGFTSQDLRHIVVPHNDPLVVTMHLGTYQVQRILVDTKSSTNILFQGCFSQMEQEHKKLKPTQMVLIGFNGKTTHAFKQLILDVMAKQFKYACFS